MTVEDASEFINAPELRDIASIYSDAFSIDWRVLVSRENMLWDPPAGIDERERVVRDFPPIFN
jgi:hypothetical protein